MDPNNLRFIPLSYSSADSQASALRLVFTLFPEWEKQPGEVRFTRFKDGITNTLMKATKHRPGLNDGQIDAEAILLRAYGRGTEILIDREKEVASHLLLAANGLAPELLARFQNGTLYRFIRGRVCSPSDLREKKIWTGVARRLGEWHSVLPVLPASSTKVPATNGSATGSVDSRGIVSEDDAANKCDELDLERINSIAPHKVVSNAWTVLQKWILALPTPTIADQKRKATLQSELEWIVSKMADLPGLGKNGMVLGHCDLLCANVIVQPPSARIESNNARNGRVNGDCVDESRASDHESVSFIDYEYAVPAPAAFDLANHFSEWGGFDCEHDKLPTRSTRRAFLREYLASYHSHSRGPSKDATSRNRGKKEEEGEEEELDDLCAAVDRFRGIPGFYWGVWALIQATISQIDFDYAAYAEIRLGEYWAWREEESGQRRARGAQMSVREKRWAEN